MQLEEPASFRVSEFFPSGKHVFLGFLLSPQCGDCCSPQDGGEVPAAVLGETGLPTLCAVRIPVEVFGDPSSIENRAIV